MPSTLTLSASALLVLWGACAPAAQLDTTRQEFIAAMQRVRANEPDLPDSAALQAYVIHDYLTAARLRRDLTRNPTEATDTAADAFLTAHAGEPVARALKRDWLTNLAQRRRWDLFLPRSGDAGEPAIACARLGGRLATGDTAGLGAAALARWVLPQRQPAECDEVFAWLRSQNLITTTAAESKSRAALGADNPRLGREAAADAAIADRAALVQWADLLESPKSTLTVLSTHPDLAVESEALAAGFDKLSRADSESALNLLPALIARPDMAASLRLKLQRSAALGAAYDHNPRAIPALAALSDDAVDPQVAEWRVRAALWTGDYGRAQEWIERMPPSLATQPRWRYWHARTLAATAGDAAAAAQFADLAQLRDYYGYLAADRLHRPYSLNVKASPDEVKLQASLAGESGLIRAHELFDCDLPDDAAAEWSAVLGRADAALKVQSAHLAFRWGWYAQAITMLAQAAEWDDVRMRYPLAYADSVATAAKLSGVPDDWIFGVMRQESLYRKDAVSKADARGLMQMLPKTATAVARRWRLGVPRNDALFEPSVALPLGAAYLRELLDRYTGHLAMALAAYNAGPAAVARWLPTKSMDGDVWVENIPYTETRSYVQHIIEHIIAFAFVRGEESPGLQRILSAVPPEM